MSHLSFLMEEKCNFSFFEENQIYVVNQLLCASKIAIAGIQYSEFAHVYRGVCVQNPVRPTGSVEQMAKVHTRSKAGV